MQHSYDLAVELFGQGRYEETAHLLVPVATNPERLGGPELLARSLFELGWLPQAEAIPEGSDSQGGFLIIRVRLGLLAASELPSRRVGGTNSLPSSAITIPTHPRSAA